jgi:uncharacterized protein (DUF2237 family)
LLEDDQLLAVQDKIASNPVVLFAMPNMACTLAGESFFSKEGICFEEQTLDGEDDPTLLYMKCLHADSIGGIDSGADNMYHSYLYIGGEYAGDGFKAEGVTDFAGAETSCTSDSIDCASIISADAKKEMDDTIANNAVVLYGWGGCPCTGIAQARLEALGTCYMQSVWPDTEDPAFKYLQCVHGEENHSFLFFDGTYYGNGFALDPKDMSDPDFQELLDDAGAVETCTKSGDSNLDGSAISSCTQSDDGTTTGWSRSGSCNWDPTDGGYHEVCVTMSDEFLKSSAEKDGNDLSSVVGGGGHWCICAWAFASAVERDPVNLEGITLECDKTNDKLREVYQHYIDTGTDLESPSGVSYEAATALEAVNKICGGSTASTVTEGAAAGTAAQLREQQVSAEEVRQGAASTGAHATLLVASAGAATVCMMLAMAVLAMYNRRSAAAGKTVQERALTVLQSPPTGNKGGTTPRAAFV